MAIVVAPTVRKVEEAHHCPLLGTACPWDGSDQAATPARRQKLMARAGYFFPWTTLVLFVTVIALLATR